MRVVLQTADRVALVGSFEPGTSKGAVLLLHMMPADRTSWGALQTALVERGVASLAIDLRGHGESLIQGDRRLDYQTFQDEDHQASLLDVDAALTWLAHRGHPAGSVALVGASIGANLALVTAAHITAIPAVALLSPGENYRGVQTFEAARQLAPTQAVWAAASQGDDQQSFDDTRRILDLVKSSDKSFHPYTSAGHGTILFQTDPQLIDTLADWIAAHFKV